MANSFLGMDPADWVRLGTAAVAPFLDNGRQTTQQTNDWGLVDTGVYPTTPDQRDYIVGGQMDILGQLMQQAAANPGAYFGGSGVGGGRRASAGRAQASTALASLIDMNDLAFAPMPPQGIREDVYGRLKSGAQSQADEARARLNQQVRAGGGSVNDPYALYINSQVQEKANAAATGGLTDFYDQWVNQALGRRAGALGENAQLQTGVNSLNANLLTQTSQTNAQLSTQASIANAQLAAQRAALAAQVGQQRFNQIFEMAKFMLSPNDHLSVITNGSQQQSGYDPGSAQYVSGIEQALRDVLNGSGGGGSASGGGYPGNPGGGAGPLLSPDSGFADQQNTYGGVFPDWSSPTAWQ